MRSVAACLISLALGCASGASIAPQASTPSLTLVYQFDGPHSEKMLQEMKRELEFILKDSGIRLDWRDRSAVSSSESFADLAVVKFHGVCEVGGSAQDAGSGPLAFTHRSDNGVILPFSEVDCNRVQWSVRDAMSRAGLGRAEMLLGRALARVLAHELYHVLAGTESHTSRGIAQRALSGADLTSDQLELDQDQLDHMHR